MLEVEEAKAQVDSNSDQIRRYTLLALLVGLVCFKFFLTY